MRLSAFDTYCLYLGLKNHFTTERYDFFKYHGKVNATKEHFLTRKDRYSFSKLSRRYDETQMGDFIISNLLNDKNWIGEMLEDEAADRFLDYQKRNQSLSYYFGNELEQLMEDITEPKDLFRGDFPELLQKHMENVVSIQTLAILNTFIPFVKSFDKRLETDFLWPKIRRKILKLTPFLSFDRKRTQRMLKEKIHDRPIVRRTTSLSQEQEKGFTKIPQVSEDSQGREMASENVAFSRF